MNIHSQEVWDLFVHYSVVVTVVAIVWVVIEVVLMAVWLAKSKELRKNLHNLIMMSSSVQISYKPHIFIRSGATTIIIRDVSFYVRSDRETNISSSFNYRLGVLQSILTKKLHERVRETVMIKEALE